MKVRFKRHLGFLAVLLGMSGEVSADGPKMKKALSPVGYQVAVLPVNIAPTPATRTEAVEVFGQPRMTRGHPNAYWNLEDIDHYKEMLKMSTELQKLLAALKSKLDNCDFARAQGTKSILC